MNVTRSTPSLLLFLCAGFALACDPVPDEVEGLGERDAGQEDDALLGYAVMASDYSSTSVGLLDPTGQLLRRNFVHSGSATAGLVTALSGDVVLPTRSGERGVLTLIDRFRTDVITRIELASGAVLGQLKTHEPSIEVRRRTYSSNPHDYVYVDEETAWVSRYEPNLAAEPGDPDPGLDLLRIDPSRFERTGERIDFGRYNRLGERTNPNTGAVDEVMVYARPAGLVRLSERLVVGVTTMSSTFDAAGKGLVGWVHPQTHEVKMIELEGLQSCGSVSPVPGDETRVAVACTGFERGVPRESAGFAMLRVLEDALTIEHVWRAREHPDAPLARYGMVVLGAHEIVAITSGETSAFSQSVDEPVDALVRIDLATGAHETIFEAGGRYVLGGGAFDPASGRLLVPDASVDALGRPIGGVRHFMRDASGRFELTDTVAVHEVLPPRQVRKLY